VLARYDINGSKYFQRENKVLLVQEGSKERKTVWFDCLGILVSWAVGVSKLTQPWVARLGCWQRRCQGVDTEYWPSADEPFQWIPERLDWLASSL
jgi:hypothetical protein